MQPSTTAAMVAHVHPEASHVYDQAISHTRGGSCASTSADTFTNTECPHPDCASHGTPCPAAGCCVGGMQGCCVGGMQGCCAGFMTLGLRFRWSGFNGRAFDLQVVPIGGPLVDRWCYLFLLVFLGVARCLLPTPCNTPPPPVPPTPRAH